GGVVSTTVIDCEQAAVLPQLSTALQARVIVCVLPQAGTPVSLKVTVGAPGQLSVAVAMPVAAGLVSPPHGTVLAAGQVRVGCVVSTTFTVFEHELVSPSMVLTTVRLSV